MVHPISEQTQNDGRLNSLEQKIARVENDLLRTSMAALEKKVAELESSLKKSNEECDKLKETIADMSAGKDVIPSKKDSSIEGLINKKDDDIVNHDGISDLISTLDDEEVIYERILKLVKNMESDCHKAINMKIPTESQLPKAPGSRLNSSKPPSPTDGLTSPSKMIGRSFTPVSTSSIPTSRVGTPSPPNATSNIQIPIKQYSSLPSPNKISHLPSRSNTPSRNHSPPSPISPSNSINQVPIMSLSKKQSRARTGSWSIGCSNIPSRPNSPHHSNISGIPTGIPSGIPSALPQKIQYRRQVTC